VGDIQVWHLQQMTIYLERRVTRLELTTFILDDMSNLFIMMYHTVVYNYNTTWCRKWV